MTFSFRPAIRENVGLLIGLIGPTGGGKTYSAMRLAAGIAGEKRFAVIDTEAGRAKHYADKFKFDHGDLKAPFRPNTYMEAIKAADEAGYPVIVVDSFSHVHAGEGGLLDAHEAELQRMAGDDWKKREAVKMAAWIKPKAAQKRLVSQLLQVRAHLVICMRAEQKVEIVKEGGKTVVRQKQSLVGADGWIPICDARFPYELTLSLLLTPAEPGVPKPIKLPEQLRLLLPLDRAIGEDTGVALAQWAAGSEAQDESTAELPALITELLELADELGKRDVTTAAIGRDRQKKVNDLAAHAAWLHGQIASARKAVEKFRAEPDENLFPAADSDPTPRPQED